MRLSEISLSAYEKNPHVVQFLNSLILLKSPHRSASYRCTTGLPGAFLRNFGK